jgi:hypothetical protein
MTRRKSSRASKQRSTSSRERIQVTEEFKAIFILLSPVFFIILSPNVFYNPFSSFFYHPFSSVFYYPFSSVFYYSFTSVFYYPFSNVFYYPFASVFYYPFSSVAEYRSSLLPMRIRLWFPVLIHADFTVLRILLCVLPCSVADPDPEFDDQNFEKNTTEKIYVCLIKSCNVLIPYATPYMDVQVKQDNPSALKRKNPA